MVCQFLSENSHLFKKDFGVDARTDAALKKLVSKHKVDGSRLKAVGFSPPAPATSNEPEEEKFKNRRAELTKQQEGQSLEKAGLFSRWRDANASNFLNSNFQIRVTGVSTSKLSKAGLFHVLYYLEAMVPVTGII